MVANPSKFQIMFLGLHQPHKLCLEINNQIAPSSDTVKLLGIDIDSKLSFDNHVKAVCAKAFVDVDKICSHKDGYAPTQIPSYFPASKIRHTYENVNIVMKNSTNPPNLDIIDCMTHTDLSLRSS